MAKRTISVKLDDIPMTLKEHPFYGLKLDQEQEYFRDCIWDNEHLIVFCNAR